MQGDVEGVLGGTGDEGDDAIALRDRDRLEVDGGVAGVPAPSLEGSSVHSDPSKCPIVQEDRVVL